MTSRARLRPLAALTLGLALTAGACGCTGDAPPELGLRSETTGTDPVDPVDPVEPRTPVDPGNELPPQDPPAPAVLVNGQGLDEPTLLALQDQLGYVVADGAYWYDPVSGAVGLDGQPTTGFLPPDLPIGGPLAEDASAGDTGVFVNGRELPFDDLLALEQLFGGEIPPGRYFLDAAGNYGYEGDVALGNVFDVVAQQQAGGGGSVVQETAGGWIGGSGEDGYYFDPDSGCSVMGGDVSC